MFDGGALPLDPAGGAVGMLGAPAGGPTPESATSTEGSGGPAGIFGCWCWSRGTTAVNARGLMEAVILPAITVSIKPRAIHIDHTPPL